MMKVKDDKTGKPKWKKLDDKTIMRARPDDLRALRQSRLGKGQDPHTEQKAISDFDIVWVYRWFMRDSIDDDYHYYTLGLEELLTDPVPLEEAYFHGIRPYAMGYAILETHKVLKPSMPILVKPIQQETNAIVNDRLDNVKLVLHKRYYVARGRQVDVNSLVRGVAGGVTLTTDPKTDIVEGQWGDITSSAYVEQDRLNADFDDLAGNFSPGTKFANKASNDTLGGTKMAAQGAGLMTDYLLRTVIETWWEKVLRQLVKLEAAYETDEKVLAICAKKAQLFPRYGISAITDEMLNDDVTLTVNVGMGASNPDAQFQKLIYGFNAVMDTLAKSPPNFNADEFIKEASSKMGYRDGGRFWKDQADPRLTKAMQLLQQTQGALDSKQAELQATAQIEQQKLLSNEKVKSAEIQVDAQRIAGDLRIRESELVIEKAKLELERMKIMAEFQKVEAPDTDTSDIDGAIEKVQNMIALHATKVDGLLAVDQAKREAKNEKEKAAAAKEGRQVAEKDAKMADDTSKKIQEQNAALMDGINKVLQVLAAKKTIKLLKQGGQTVGAEVS